MSATAGDLRDFEASNCIDHARMKAHWAPCAIQVGQRKYTEAAMVAVAPREGGVEAGAKFARRGSASKYGLARENGAEHRGR
mmetsp:Transcript_18595/g.46629  ORF Transcript_18595/g.46629 Transcript_18595/m.46629 type:complete len:82 (+) Transcript_18595:228-473(+)